MEEQEVKEPKHVEVNKEFEKKIDENKIKIKMKKNEIMFIVNISLSFYKYVKRFKYNEIIEELKLDKNNYKNLKQLYIYLTERKFEINEEEKILIIDYKEVKLEEKKLTNEELIKELVSEIKDIKERSRKEKEDLENKYNNLKEHLYELDDIINSDKYRNEINLIYKTKKNKECCIFGQTFVEINKDKIELDINGNKSDLVSRYKLKKGNNNIKMIIKKKLKYLGKCFMTVKL